MPHVHGEATLARIFLGESDRWQGRPLFEVLVEKARRSGIRGATVLRGVEGYGLRSVIHRSRLLALSEDLPLVIEIVDRRERIEPYLAEVEILLDEAGAGGLVTFEKVQVIRAVAGNPPPGGSG